MMLIATRTLKLRGDGGTTEIPIRVFAPENADGHWTCCYEIGWPGKARTMQVAGADATQALVLALQMIGSEIYTSNYHKSGELYWDAPGRGYGFPVPASLRGLLEGDDLKFL